MIYAGIDFETRSEVDLKASGVHVYAEHESTEVLCLAWAIGDEPVSVWHAGGPAPARLFAHVASGGAVRAWNAGFELTIWEHVLSRQLPRRPPLRAGQTFDTMVQALVLALPGSLELCAVAMGASIKKDAEGKALMRRMCKPLPSWIKSGAGAKWHDTPEARARLGEYCKVDVEVERQLAARLAPLSDSERRNWLLDRRVNSRGVPIDLVSVANARRIIDGESAWVNDDMSRATGGLVAKATNAPALQKWLAARGIYLDDMRKQTVSDTTKQLRSALASIEASAMPEALRSEMADALTDAIDVLELRTAGGGAAVKKLNAMQVSTSADGRARDLLRYGVATTGRWAGTRIQIHNLKRPTLELDEIADAIELMRDARTGADMLRYSHGQPSDVVASCLRAMICAPPGREFIGGDFANIEGRVLAWLAGEAWKLQAFRDFDTVIPGKFDKKGKPLRVGADLYMLAYSRSFGVEVSDVSKPQRQIGKVQELALGYQGGVGAFMSMAAIYGISIPELAAAVIAAAGAQWAPFVADLWAKPFSAMHYAQWKSELTRDEWAALKFVVARWRAAHPETLAFWYDLQNCAQSATLNRGQTYATKTGSIRFQCNKHFLFCQLPSGRVLAYPQPSVVPKRDGITGQIRDTLQYRTVVKNSWVKSWTYGGHLAENVTQAAARDLLADSMHRLEAKGYPLIMHVHDEDLSEVAAGFGSLAEYEAIMGASEPWAYGLPVAAEAWRGVRYQK